MSDLQFELTDVDPQYFFSRDNLNTLKSSFPKIKLVQRGQTIKALGEKNELKDFDKKIINLCNKTELKTLPNIFKNARLIVGNDTGTSHLVATTKTPMIEMFGPTDPNKCKPLSTNIVAIRAPNLSMKNISVDYVFKKLKEILWKKLFFGGEDLILIIHGIE